MTILVGKKAPDFTTHAVFADGSLGELNFGETIKGKYAVLFFYPLDFTFVCPTELIAMDNRMGKLESLGAEVVGVSIDSHFTHLAWRNTPVEEGGIGQVGYTLAADMDHSICKAYGVESGDDLSGYPNGAAMRATYVIDPEGVVRHMVVNDEPLGRNFDEVVRIIEGYQFFKANGQVCPAGWETGKDGFKAGADGNLNEYLSENASNL